MLTLEPTQSVPNAAGALKNIYSRKERQSGERTPLGPPLLVRVRSGTMMADSVEVRTRPTGGRIGANQVSKFDREGRGDDEGLTKRETYPERGTEVVEEWSERGWH